MAGAIVTSNFEERSDTLPTLHHMNTMQDRIRASLMSTGREYSGVEIDGMLYSQPERVMIATHKGPMLGKFTNPNPSIDVRTEIKKISGNGKNSLAGHREVQLEWFSPCCKLFIDPRSGRGGQEVVGWSNYGVDYNKSGSIMATLLEWLPHMGLSEIDPITMGGLLDGLSGKDSYVMMFIKAVLTFRTICVGYSVEGCKWQGCKKLPPVLVGNKRRKVGQVGAKECTIDLDSFTNIEAFVAMLSSKQYPVIQCANNGVRCVYTELSLPECDVQFVSGEHVEFTKTIPSPEQWWKALVGLATKLGAIEDLVTAFRVSRGLASWAVGLKSLGFDDYGMTLGITGTRGCRSVLLDSVLSRSDKVTEPTNLPCSLGELVCDWAAGQEMINMLFHLSDEFGLANTDLNRNVSGLVNCSVGDSILREACFYDFGYDNRFYSEMRDRMDTKVAFLGDEDLKLLLQTVTAVMLSATAPEAGEIRDCLRKTKNLAFSNYYGPLWKQNATAASRLEGVINSCTWGATSRSKKEVFYLRMWLDINGLSDEILLFGGFNAIQKIGLESINHTSISKIEGAHGVYSEVYRELNWRDSYETRLGSESREKDRMDFVKTYLGMEEEEIGVVEPAAQPVVKAVPLAPLMSSYRGTLGTEKVGKKPPKDKDKIKEKVGSTPINIDVVEELDEDITAGVGSGGLPPKPPEMGNASSRVFNTFGTRGVGGYSRGMQANGGNFKVKKIPGDGYCVARALAYGMREGGFNTTDEHLIEYIRREQETSDWFEVEGAALLMQKLGVGVAIYDTRDGTLSGIGTTGKDPANIVGITFDGAHCDALVTGLNYDMLIPSCQSVYERDDAAVNEMVDAIFRGNK